MCTDFNFSLIAQQVSMESTAKNFALKIGMEKTVRKLVRARMVDTVIQSVENVNVLLDIQG